MRLPIDFSIIFLHNNNDNNYTTNNEDLKREIRRMWSIKKVDVLLVDVRAPGSVTKKLGQWIEK